MESMVVVVAPRNRNCDKCGRLVPPENDVARLDAYRTDGNPLLALFAHPRHLLPIVENGDVVCEGSPSRAQYLEGQPRDPRGTWGYHPELEEVVRTAYVRMRHEYFAFKATTN